MSKRKPRAVVTEQGDVAGTVVPVARPFSWSDVPAKDRGWLKEVTDQVRIAAAAVSAELVRIGQFIREAKERLPHGTFIGWCESELPWGRTTVHRLARAAEVFGGVECSKLEQIEPSALYVLAAPSTPPEVRQKALEAAGKGEPVTHEQAARLVAESKADAGKRPSPPPGHEVVMDRLDEMGMAGEMVFTGDPGEPPARTVTLTYAEYKLLLRRLFRESFPDDTLPAPPITAPPGSKAKQDLMAVRAALGQPLCQAGDQLPDDQHQPDIVARSGGAGRVCEACGRRMPPAPVVRGWKRKKGDR